MLNIFGANVTPVANEDRSRLLIAAYESALLTISGGRSIAFPDYPTRLLLFETMTEEGNVNGFDAEKMTRAGLLAVEAREVS